MVKRDLSQILADLRGDAAVLDRAGQPGIAARYRELADDIAASAEPWLTWLSEVDAMLRSGRSREWLRARFPDLERDGNGRLTQAGERQYRECAIPREHRPADARAAGEAAALRFRKSA